MRFVAYRHYLILPTHAFISTYSSFCRYVPKLAIIAAPVNIKFRKYQPRIYLEFFDKEVCVLHTLQEKLISSPVLAVPKLGGPHTVNTNACNRHVGGVVHQKQLKEHNKPIRDWSQSLRDKESTQDSTHQECFEDYGLYCSSAYTSKAPAFIIWTDHEVFKCIPNLFNTTGSLGQVHRCKITTICNRGTEHTNRRQTTGHASCLLTEKERENISRDHQRHWGLW